MDLKPEPPEDEGRSLFNEEDVILKIPRGENVNPMDFLPEIMEALKGRDVKYAYVGHRNRTKKADEYPCYVVIDHAAAGEKETRSGIIRWLKEEQAEELQAAILRNVAAQKSSTPPG